MKKFKHVLAIIILILITITNTSTFFAKKINYSNKSLIIKSSLNSKYKTISESNPFIEDVPNLVNQSVQTIAVAPNGTVYANVNMIFSMSLNGEDFVPVIGLPEKSQVIAVTISQSGTIYVGLNNDGGLYQSTDGDKFVQTTDFFNKILISQLVTTPEGKIFVGTSQNGLYKSTDGKNFVQIFNKTVSSLALSLDGTIYIGSSNVNQISEDGLYKSTDEETFSKLENNHFNFKKSKIAINSEGVVYVGLNNSSNDDGLYWSVEDKDFKKVEGFPSNLGIKSLAISQNGIVYASKETNNNEFYLSRDGKKFNQVSEITSSVIDIAFAPNGTIYLGCNSSADQSGLIIGNLANKLMNFKKPDYSGNLYSGFVYQNIQRIGITPTFLDTENISLDHKRVTFPYFNLQILNGTHTLGLTLNKNYKKFAELFGVNQENGQIDYNFWVKSSIDPIADINYKAVNGDTKLVDGLTSNEGNTKDAPIIQTEAVVPNEHAAQLEIKIKSNLIDYSKSSCYLGSVDESTNSFKNSDKSVNVTKNFRIKVNGIYQLQLVDLVGNVYTSYLELGINNWKLKGSVNNGDLIKSANELNVTLTLDNLSITTKQGLIKWLRKYKNDATKAFKKSLAQNGTDFKLKVKDLSNQYRSFLDPIDYKNWTTPSEKINETNLAQAISKAVENKLDNELSKLPSDFNVDTSNVVNNWTLQKYKTWINSYQKFIGDRKTVWFNDICRVGGRGFATDNQIQQIKNYIDNLDFSQYLSRVTWKPTINNHAGTNTDFQRFIELDKLQTDVNNWVSSKLPNITKQYNDYLASAISKADLHGYTVKRLLNGKQLPQTKDEIDYFVGSKSFTEWLQSEANSKHRLWQIMLGTGIGVPLLIIGIAAWIFIYRKWFINWNPYLYRGRAKVYRNITIPE